MSAIHSTLFLASKIFYKKRHANINTHTHLYTEVFSYNLFHTFFFTHFICMRQTGMNLNYSACEATFMPGDAFTCVQLEWLINQLVCLLSELIWRACFFSVWSVNTSIFPQMQSRACWWFCIESCVIFFMIEITFLVSRNDYESVFDILCS